MRFGSDAHGAARCLRKLRVGSLILAMLCLSSCHDEPEPSRSFTLAQAWPNEDGRVWAYEVTATKWLADSILDLFSPQVVFETPDDVPPVPSMRDVATLLAAELEGEPLESAHGLYTLQFSGTATTHSGATGQNLVGTMSDVPVEAQTAEAAEASSFFAVFLARLALARPDLRPSIEARIGRSMTASSISQPMFLSGGVWEKTDEWVGKYGDVDTTLAWLYLDADLDVGHEFTWQLVPSLADDVFLYGKVHRKVTVENGAGRFEDALEVLYEIDYGAGVAVNNVGDILGYYRLFDIARITYAPDVGPVESTERTLYLVGAEVPVGPLLARELPLQSTQLD